MTDTVLAPISKENHVVSTGPVWAVIIPTEPVDLPADLLADAQRYHAKLMQARAVCCFKVQSFEDWLADVVRNSVYGPGEDMGAAQDWLER
jgi:hypothetical protein